MKNQLLTTFLILFSLQLSSQDLLDVLDAETPETSNVVTATFKGTRIVNGHSIENRKKKELEFIISHRFGRINTGFEELFGLDQSNIRFSFEYGLTDNLTAGLGRSSFEKTYDGFLKYSLIKQKTGANSFPFAVSLFGSIAAKSQKAIPGNERTFAESLFYTAQVLFAKKINSTLSFQVTPTYVHRNLTAINEDPHDIFALGFGTRIKLSKRVSLNAEYYPQFQKLKSIDAKNSLAFGVDIETGGHVFQIILSNAITMIEKGFITESTGSFFGGDIHLGFNLSRTF
ncbi:hypothetical protein FDT66_11455 [Polaribacter aestuariivivens]|uniref:DUF5777 domain-containing protein n=1 Tax=Polaribacter aestuariivivens TaxID=2304626 RepID=A0A5S3N839_9FLAO|nr:DUF5777 family beta-barrel protein [Polaribacter aestuariivivens]TMM28996.1 hypothetical protein FDT66_11455 [Polaribacter aestuariivivens]